MQKILASVPHISNERFSAERQCERLSTWRERLLVCVDNFGLGGERCSDSLEGNFLCEWDKDFCSKHSNSSFLLLAVPLYSFSSFQAQKATRGKASSTSFKLTCQQEIMDQPPGTKKHISKGVTDRQHPQAMLTASNIVRETVHLRKRGGKKLIQTWILILFFYFMAGTLSSILTKPPSI